MVNRLIKWCLHNPFLVILAVLLVTAIGIFSITKIPVDAIPDIGENQQVIIADWMGRDAKTIESQVTYPLTSRLFGIPGVKAIRASSAFGFSMVYVTFEESVTFTSPGQGSWKSWTAGSTVPSGRCGTGIRPGCYRIRRGLLVHR